MQLLKFTINKGEEMIDVLAKKFAEQNLKSGAIISVVGAIDYCRISTMAKDDPMEDFFTEYSEPLEINGVGEIREGKPHIHINLGRENGQTASGHLHYAKVESWYVTVFVAVGS
ncbi:MAG: hypothetical protein UR28_C0021G0019 [Candidatus Peregrinibacteria bacterium GW2011_GWF2_33_10]|nr:MAG: hypothetical protein UR28_C0021G0019 [Candidatus Peregrinibacteria bacterium GW2011_GWF2_33_10]